MVDVEFKEDDSINFCKMTQVKKAKEHICNDIEKVKKDCKKSGIFDIIFIFCSLVFFLWLASYICSKKEIVETSQIVIKYIEAIIGDFVFIFIMFQIEFLSYFYNKEWKKKYFKILNEVNMITSEYSTEKIKDILGNSYELHFPDIIKKLDEIILFEKLKNSKLYDVKFDRNIVFRCLNNEGYIYNIPTYFNIMESINLKDKYIVRLKESGIDFITPVKENKH